MLINEIQDQSFHLDIHRLSNVRKQVFVKGAHEGESPGHIARHLDNCQIVEGKI